MKCESCNIKEIEVEEPSPEGFAPYCLCLPCHKRLLNKALRPLEYFNLASIHGHSSFLQDDFYDNESGEATQPDIEVLEAEKFPFPDLNMIKCDLKKLIDFACVQYFIKDDVISFLKQHDNQAVLNYLDKKVNYNRAINYKTYEIVARVVGQTGEAWIKNEWSIRKDDELLIFAEAISKCLPFEEAFELLITEIEKKNDKHLSENISALLYFQNSWTLDWIEKMANRIINVSSNWGILTSTSQFTWDRAEKWLTIGRPLSLIALDALVFCTTTGNRDNQAFWLQQNPPKLMDSEGPDIIAKRLNEYLNKDNVQRTRNAVDTIIKNLFNTE